MSGNDWKRGLERIEPGIYADTAGVLHVDEEELLTAHGYPMNAHNSKMIREAAAKITADMGINLESEYVCARCGATVSDPATHTC